MQTTHPYVHVEEYHVAQRSYTTADIQPSDKRRYLHLNFSVGVYAGEFGVDYGTDDEMKSVEEPSEEYEPRREGKHVEERASQDEKVEKSEASADVAGFIRVASK